MNNLKTLFLFRLKNQMKLFNLSSTNKEVRKHAFYTTLGYAAAFLMFLGYVLFITIDLNASHNIQALFVLISSILFWTFGIWNNLSGFDDIIDSQDSDFIFSLPIKNWKAKLLPLLSRYFIQINLTFIVLIFGYILTISVINNYLFVFIMILLLSFIIPLLSTNVTFLIALLVRDLLTVIKLCNNVTESILTLGIFATPLIYFMLKSESINYKEVFINASILRYPLNEIITFHFFFNLILLSVIAIVTTFIVIFTLVYFHDFLKSQKGKQLKIRNTNTTWTVKTPIYYIIAEGD